MKRGHEKRAAARRVLAWPALWGALYLAAVPGFAIVYSGMDSGFRLADPRAETEFDQVDGPQLLVWIKTSVLAALAVRQSGDPTQRPQRLQIGDWSVEPADCGFMGLDVVDQELRFTLFCPLYGRVAGNVEQVNASYRVGVDLRSGLYTGVQSAARQGVWGMLFRARVTTESEYPQPTGLADRAIEQAFFVDPLVLPTRGAGPSTGFKKTADPNGVFYASPELFAGMRAFVSGIRGDAAALSGRYWRFLYLSAVTITTLGYGDIIPVSRAARLLVGTQAIAGVVLAGLFLNAVARRGPKRGK